MSEEFNLKRCEPEFMVQFSNSMEKIVTIHNDGTVEIHKEGGDKEAAKVFYESLQIEGTTLHQKIDRLTAELEEAYKRIDAHIEKGNALEQELAEAIRKGEGLCDQNGGLMIENHDLKKELSTLKQGVEVEGILDFSDFFQASLILVDDASAFPANWLSKAVVATVLLKEEP